MLSLFHQNALSFNGATIAHPVTTSMSHASIVMMAKKKGPIKKKSKSKMATAATAVAEAPSVDESYDAGLAMEGVVVPTKDIMAAVAAKNAAAEPVAEGQAPEVAWFPSNAAELAPPVFQWRPYLKVLGVKPGDDAPAHLDGSMAGDVGFDPLCLTALAQPEVGPALLWQRGPMWTSSYYRATKLKEMSAEDQETSLNWMREAEVKHARLAMLAAAGWPLAELWSPLRGAMSNGRAPSLFNGHLFDANNLIFTMLVFGGIGFLETQTDQTRFEKRPEGYVAGDLGFDPAKFATDGLSLELPVVGKVNKTPEELRLSEIKNGRLAMLAITGFAVQEFLYGSPVVQQTPMFF